MDRDDTRTLAPRETGMHAHASNDPSSAEVRLHGHLRGHHHHGHHRAPGVVPGLVVVAWGTLLLLRELGVLSSELRALDFWPLLLVGFGLSTALGGRRLGARLLGLVVALFGLALLGEKLGWVPVGVAQLWPVLIVAAGLAILWNGLTRRHRPRTASSEAVSADEVQRSVTMGSLKLLVDSQQFKGGSIHATMGEVQLDLRRAAFEGEEVALDLSLLMSGVEIHVPGHWRVASDVSQTMGAVEDKTDPRPDAAGVQKRLRLRGHVTMGAVTIRN
jgi:predicted membrane protein